MSGLRWRRAFVAAGLILAFSSSAAPTRADREVLRVRTLEDLVTCVERALAAARPEIAVEVESGDPRETEGVDLVVGVELELTRTLESGRADAAFAVSLGEGPAGAPARIVAAPVGRSARYDAARALTDLLNTPRAQQAFADCAGLRPLPGLAAQRAAFTPGMARYALAVPEWWMPGCALKGNAYTDPNTALGAPDAFNAGARGESNYRGMISLGQGGYVVVDMGQSIVNRSGAEIRVYQFTSGEPVSVYGGDNPTGPFSMIGFRRYCGNRVPGGPNNWGYCDFDLAEGGLASARYIKVEDGELFPCLRGGTDNEGADIDAVELLNQ